MQSKVEFKSYDGTRLVGIMQSPEGVIPKGAFLLMHGIPSEKNEWGFYSDMASFLEDEGYISFRFDFRCNGESEGGDLHNLTISEMVNDIDAAYSMLKKTFDGEIYAVGTSCGGGVTIRWANVFQRDIAKIFLMAPVTDYLYEVLGVNQNQTYDLNDSISEQIEKNLHATGKIDGEIPYGIAMLNEARAFRCNNELELLTKEIVIFQGNADSVVPIEKTRDIAKVYADKIELIEIDGADHGFAIPGDEDLTDEGTKINHFDVYGKMIERVIRV